MSDSGAKYCIIFRADSYLEYVIVEEYHDDAGYVEAGQARVDDKVRIVEQTLVRYPVRGVIQA